MKLICHSCKKEIDLSDKVGFRETCEFCDADLHCCLQCSFYDTAAYNECRESSADRVLDKDRANYCDYFQGSSEQAGAKQSSAADDAKAKLEALFKK
ncbi:MAG: hypothetical protein H7A33_04080 [Deltaproteobacteria bacterium]|nr:hypothetical protein [Deltaproteobacteria bacterium]